MQLEATWLGWSIMDLFDIFDQLTIRILNLQVINIFSCFQFDGVCEIYWTVKSGLYWNDTSGILTV